MDIKASFLSSIFGFCCFAQDNPKVNTYFKSYDEKVIASLYVLNTSNSFEAIVNSEGTRRRFEFVPNRRSQIGASLSYKFIDVSYGLAPKFIEDNKDNKGSKFLTFDTRFYLKRWAQSILFINQTGFNINDGEIEIAFPKFRSTKIGGVTSYVCNDKFSFRTLANQRQWQTKSAGSFIPSLAFVYTNLDLNDSTGNTHSDIYTVSLAPSYFYNWVIDEHLLIASGISVGAGITSIDRDVYPVYEFRGNLKVAYNSDSFFTFMRINTLNFIQDDQAEIQLNDNLTVLNFVIGYRFNPPKKVQEVYQKVTKKIGL